MISKDEIFKTGNQERTWQKYCGFFDLSLAEFMEIQEQLLMEQKGACRIGLGIRHSQLHQLEWPLPRANFSLSTSASNLPIAQPLQNPCSLLNLLNDTPTSDKVCSMFS